MNGKEKPLVCPKCGGGRFYAAVGTAWEAEPYEDATGERDALLSDPEAGAILELFCYGCSASLQLEGLVPAPAE